MKSFCCDSAQNRFREREGVGEFLVAGPNRLGQIAFHSGYLAVHRKDWSDVLGTTAKAHSALKAAGVSNLKLFLCSRVHYCAGCGAELIQFYGPDGGALRDDDFVRRMGGTT